jgi:hypothetical protein
MMPRRTLKCLVLFLVAVADFEVLQANEQQDCYVSDVGHTVCVDRDAEWESAQQDENPAHQDEPPQENVATADSEQTAEHAVVVEEEPMDAESHVAEEERPLEDAPEEESIEEETRHAEEGVPRENTASQSSLQEEAREEIDPICPSRRHVIRCTAQYLDTNNNNYLERSELQSAIDQLPWLSRGE